jgi:hypothetical protein
MSRVCSTRNMDDKYMQECGLETRKKEKPTKTLMYARGLYYN